MNNLQKEKKYKKIIGILSIALPLIIALLFGVRIPNVAPLSFLPPIYASINGFTAIVLVAAVVAIKKGNRKQHERLITLAMVCSILFLVLYVAYHMTSDPTKFGGEGWLKYIYYFILITHILLSIAVIPMVLITFMRAKLGNFAAHKKIAKITFPLWLYVAISGVLVYVLIAPYYV